MSTPNYPSIGLDDISLLAPDTILPAQYYARAQKLGPEARLWFATLMDVIRTIQTRRVPPGQADRPRMITQVYRDALAWLSDDGNHLGSFHYVCEIFDLDPDYIRLKLTTANPVPRNRPTGMTANRCGVGYYQDRTT